MIWLPVFGIFNMRTNVDGRGDCMDAIRESALKTDPGRKIPCRTRDLNPCQYCTWLFSQTLYQLSYPAPFKAQFLKTIQPCCPDLWHRLLATGTLQQKPSNQRGCPAPWNRLLATGTLPQKPSNQRMRDVVQISGMDCWLHELFNKNHPISDVVQISGMDCWLQELFNKNHPTMLSRSLAQTAGYRNSSTNSNGMMAISCVAPLTYQWEFCILCIWRKSGMLPGKRWMTNSLHAPPHLSPGKKKKDTSSPGENNTPITW